MKKFLKQLYPRIPVIKELCKMVNYLRQILQSIHQIQSTQAIQAVDWALEKHPRFSDPQRLHKYAFQVNSQNSEDGMLHEIFRRVGTTGKYFVEIGVGDGRENNTAFLLSQDWHGTWFDADAAFASNISRRPDLRDHIQCVVSPVNAENVNELFEKAKVPLEFDLLSVDIDQNTFYIWKALEAYRPRVVVVEYNSNVPAHVDWVCRYHPERIWDGSANLGASLLAFEKLGAKMGYALVGCDILGLNAFFVRQDLAGDKFCQPYSTENHYEPPRFALMHRRGHKSIILDRPSVLSHK